MLSVYFEYFYIRSGIQFVCESDILYDFFGMHSHFPFLNLKREVMFYILLHRQKLMGGRGE